MIDLKDSIILNRFWSKVEKTDYCWNWIGSLRQGYGILWIIEKNYSSHRLSWELHNGSILNNLHVLHKCDNRKCIKPEHLFLGTNADNMKDRNNKNRQAKLKGEKHGRSKLTKKQVIEIRDLYNKGDISQRKIAKIYSISQTNTKDIIKRKIWKHV